MQRTALIVGAAGAVGSETARALVAHGWHVRALARDPERAARALGGLDRVEWLRGDALVASDVARGAAGASVLVHAVNPPGYRNWGGLVLPMLESSIAAAKAARARIVLPGTVYNFGPEGIPVARETTPQRPTTRKGRIRVAMEQRLAEAARSGVPALVVRAGDFFGAPGQNSWFNQIVTPGRPVRAVTYPGAHDAGHAWAYLPDLGETIARLLGREAESFAPFDVFHFGGHWFERGAELPEAILRVAGAPAGKIRRFPWLAVRLLAPFVETLRETIEMRYLWSQPLRLENDKLVRFLGQEPHTPLEDALGATLRRLDCAARFSGNESPKWSGSRILGDRA